MTDSSEQCFSVNLSGSIAHLEDLALALHKICEAFALSKKIENQLNLILEELYANSVNYAFSKVAKPIVKIDISLSQGELKFIYQDNGPAFNPLVNQMPDLELTLEDRPIGGLGILLVKTLTDDVSYQYQDGFNQIVMIKHIGTLS